MNIDDLILVSVDDHVVEPPDMWEGRVPAKYKDTAPVFVHKDNGTDVWRYEGVEYPNVGLNAVAGRPKHEYGMEPTSLEEIRRGCWDVNERVKDMNANGVLGSMNFPSLAGFAGQLFTRTADKDQALALLHAYNDWHIDGWCNAAPGRFIPLGSVPLWDPNLGAAEVRRLAAKGCHAIMFSENPFLLGLPSMNDPHWDPLWAACSDEGTVVCTHIGSSSNMPFTSPDAPVDVMITVSPVNLLLAASDLIWSPLFRKFPNLTFALSEGGIGWIPYFLERIDYVYQQHKAWTGQDFGDKLPSQVFREHVVTCFIDDAFGVQNRHTIGIDMITWECDYPHSDSTWPHAPESCMKYLAGLPDGEIDKITHLNAMRIFQYDPFSVLGRQNCTVGALRAAASGHDISEVSKGKKSKPGLTLAQMAAALGRE